MPTVADWFEVWLTTIAPRTVAQSTLESTYEPKVRHWISPNLGKHRLDRLQPEHLDALYTKLAAEGLKPNTILQIHRIISRALKIAWKRGKVTQNVASLVDAPVGEETDIEPLTRAEARQILATAASRRNGVRWSVALALGIRQSEAIGLRWQFVDLDAGTIEVGWQLKRAHFRHGCGDCTPNGTPIDSRPADTGPLPAQPNRALHPRHQRAQPACRQPDVRSTLGLNRPVLAIMATRNCNQNCNQASSQEAPSGQEPTSIPSSGT